MATKVVYFESIGEVTFFRNQRSRRLKISVKPDKSVLVSYPILASEKEVMSFLAKNENWIIRQQELMADSETVYTDGSVIRTKLFTIYLLLGETQEIERNGKTIKLTVQDFRSGQGRHMINSVLTQVYGIEARQILPGRLRELAAKYNFVYNRVTIRNNKRRWGSCSSKNNISLNLQMMKLPFELIDFILLHELVHTEIKNHGPRFWEKLNQVTSDRANELVKEVKKYSTYTF
jgi:predicted metal-dependent hydrolase